MINDSAGLPVEIIQLIVGYMKASPDYMHARQIDRQFSYPGLLWCRFIKTHMTSFHEALKIDDNTYLWTNEYFPKKRDDICAWGLTVDASYIHECGLCRSCFHDQLAIVRIKRASEKCCPFERLFAIDISVPDNKTYSVDCECWVEYDEEASIPFKYISLFSREYHPPFPCPFPKSQLIRMVDVWQSKRLDIYLTWDTPLRDPICHRLVATTFSKYGLLMLTCGRDSSKFLLVGRPRYIGHRNGLDMSQLFDYFYYIINKRLAVLVDMTGCYPKNDKHSAGSSQPVYYPLIKHDWFGSRSMFFHVPSQITVPTYEQFVARRSKGILRPSDCQTNHISLILDINNRHYRPLVPDAKICLPNNMYLISPLYDNMFIFYMGKEESCDGVIDARLSSLDFTIETNRVRALKLPHGKIQGCLDDYMFFDPPADEGFYYHKLEVASLLYGEDNRTDGLLAGTLNK